MQMTVWRGSGGQREGWGTRGSSVFILCSAGGARELFGQGPRVVTGGERRTGACCGLRAGGLFGPCAGLLAWIGRPTRWVVGEWAGRSRVNGCCLPTQSDGADVALKGGLAGGGEAAGWIGEGGPLCAAAISLGLPPEEWSGLGWAGLGRREGSWRVGSNAIGVGRATTAASSVCECACVCAGRAVVEEAAVAAVAVEAVVERDETVKEG